jgi:hypothetical protein
VRIAVVGNCQARPIADLMQQMCPGATAETVIVVHLSTVGAQEAEYRALRQADVIVAQYVSDQYHNAHLATSQLLREFEGKVVTWPNVFFRGQCPDLSYASSSLVPRVLGPLREYHLRTIYQSWISGRSSAECLSLLRSPDASYEEEWLAIARHSLVELQARERSLDVQIADVIDAQWRDSRLFFTFNHPTLLLLARVAERLLTKVGAPATLNSHNGHAEPLSLVAPPIIPQRSRFTNWAWASETSVGATISIDKRKVEMGSKCSYTLPDLVAKFYCAYDAQLCDSGDKVKFSPPGQALT